MNFEERKINATNTRVSKSLRSGKNAFSRELSMDDHSADDHGTIHRRDRKSDKSMSARQWKKFKRAARKAA